METHFRILAWKIPWTEEAGGLQSMGLQRVGHDWAASLSFSLNCGAICKHIVSLSPSLYKWKTALSIKDLNVRPETIKLLEENIGKTLSDINHSRILYDPHPRILETKANKWDLMKLKSFCTAKETVSKVKRQPSDWEKIIANEATKD